MLWSVIRVIFKTSSVTPDFFYVFNLVLSFSTCSQSFNKICVWEVLGANVLKLPYLWPKNAVYVWTGGANGKKSPFSISISIGACGRGLRISLDGLAWH